MAKVKDSGDALEDDFQLSDTEYLSDGQDAGEVFDESGDEAAAGSKRKAAPAVEAPKKKKKVYWRIHAHLCRSAKENQQTYI